MFCPVFLHSLSLALNLGCSPCCIRIRRNNCELLCGEFVWPTTNANHPDNFLVDLTSSQRKSQSHFDPQTMKPTILFLEKHWSKHTCTHGCSYKPWLLAAPQEQEVQLGLVTPFPSPPSLSREKHESSFSHSYIKQVNLLD